MTKENDPLNSSTPAGVRAYEQDVCGLVEKFCSEKRKSVPASIQDDIINLRINNISYQAFPIKIYDGSVGIFVIEGDNAYVLHENNNPKLSQKNTAHNLPKELGILLSTDYQNNYDKGNIYSRIEQKTGKSFVTNASGHKEMDISDTPESVLSSFQAVFYCNFTLVSKVEDFLEVFYGSSNDQNMYDVIEAAFTNAGCPAAYPDYYNGGSTGEFYRCSNTCIDPRCLVDYLLALDEGLSEEQKHLIIARYLSETMELTNDEQDWLEGTENITFARSIYDGFAVDRNVNRCTGTDCGILGGYHEAIIQRRAGEILTSQETEGLLDFFSVMRCNDGEIYSCFREAQQNPESEVATFLNEIKELSFANPRMLVDGCDDLDEYAERWANLATFDALSVPGIEERLEELDEDGEYWIQTLENAMTPRFWWVQPVANMDFFGVTIESLPTDPSTGMAFTSPEVFFDFIQRNFATTAFYGENSPCSIEGPVSQYFEYNFIDDFNTWISDDPISTVFTIHLPDDGSVICTDFEYGKRFQFSTLNAPGWLEGDSWDGFHPVSGNREFGIIDNNDGTIEFYTSAVDRATLPYHVLFQGASYGMADEFWDCLLDTIKDFVNDNDGVASDNYNCTIVRPLWQELKDVLKGGCEGLTGGLENFPCESSSACL